MQPWPDHQQGALEVLKQIVRVLAGKIVWGR
jgi:hypothetical protein